MPRVTNQDLIDQVEESELLPEEREEWRYVLPPELLSHFQAAVAGTEKKPRSESPTSIQHWLTCPLNWWATKYAPVPEKTAMGPALVVGSVAHRILEVFYCEPPAMRTDDLLDSIVRKARDLLDSDLPVEVVIEDGLLVQEDVERWRAVRSTGLKWMNNYLDTLPDVVDSILDIDDDPRKVAVSFTERFASRWTNGLKIVGKVDRGIESESGMVIVDDYKSGKAPDEGAKIDVLTARYFQLGIYAWILSYHNRISVEAVRMLFLKKPAAVYRINVKENTIRLVDAALKIITTTMKESIETGVFYAVPDHRQTGHCSDCPLVGHCPVRDGASNEDLMSIMDPERLANPVK